MPSPRRLLTSHSLGLLLTLATPAVALAQQSSGSLSLGAGASASPSGSTATADGTSASVAPAGETSASGAPAAPQGSEAKSEAKGEAKSDERSAPPTLGLEFGLGGAVRVNDSATGVPVTQRLGVGLHGGVFFGLDRLVALGVTYNQAQAGVESLSISEGNFSTRTQRALQAVLLELRFFPLRGEKARLFLGMKGGIAWEQANSVGSETYASGSSPIIVTYGCRSSGKVGFSGLGVDAGVDVELGGSTSLLLRGSAMNYRLPSTPLLDGNDYCTQGAGSTTMVQAEVGLSYRFDLGSSER